MYRPEGIDQVIWKFAKSGKTVCYEHLKEVIAEYSGLDLEDVSNRAVYEIVSSTVANAIAEGGIIKAHMFYEFTQAVCPPQYIKNLFASNEEFPLELQMIYGMLNMIRHVQVKNKDLVFIELD